MVKIAYFVICIILYLLFIVSNPIKGLKRLQSNSDWIPFVFLFCLLQLLCSLFMRATIIPIFVINCLFVVICLHNCLELFQFIYSSDNDEYLMYLRMIRQIILNSISMILTFVCIFICS